MTCPFTKSLNITALSLSREVLFIVTRVTDIHDFFSNVPI